MMYLDYKKERYTSKRGAQRYERETRKEKGGLWLKILIFLDQNNK